MRHRIFRVFSAFTGKALSLVVRTIVTTTVFGVFLVSVLHYMGVPIPTAQELLHGFEGLSKLTKVLS